MTTKAINKPMILAIDTSCDDTSAAVTQGFIVLSNVIASQAQLHQQYGGVFPTVAKLAHKEKIEPSVELALQRAGVPIDQIDVIAVTQGPGLAPALEVGINYAKELADKYNLLLIPTNHIEGHLLSVLAQPKTKKTRSSYQLPALGIIVSGGHTQFVKVDQIGQYQILGSKLDDAAGECLDKIGRMLNLGYPAGPIIEQFAKKGDQHAIDFPLPLTTIKTYDMSFSGLKTFAKNTLKEMTNDGQKPLTKQQVYDFAASSQYAVFRHISYKLEKLLADQSAESQFKEVWLGGGVAANASLRKMIRASIKPFGLKLKVPYTKKLCMDNAAMIGVTAGQHSPGNDKNFERKPKLKLDQAASNSASFLSAS